MKKKFSVDRSKKTLQSPFGNKDESLSAKKLVDNTGDNATEITELLQRMRHGDREAAAEFVIHFGDIIMRRIRGKLSPTMRRIFDSRDILSTVGRRLDRFVESGKIKAESEPQLWSLVFRIANNAVLEKGRVIRRLKRLEGEDGFFAQELMRRFRAAERIGKGQPDIEIERIIDFIDDKVDKEIICLWLSGTPHDVTSICVNLAPTAVRKRWQKIKIKLRDLLETELQS